MPRLRRFIEAMTQFGQVIEVFVNANDFVCFIWVAKTHLDTFDKLLDAYAQIGDAIPGLSVYKGVFDQHETLKVVMQDYFSDILRFHEEAIKIFARSRKSTLVSLIVRRLLETYVEQKTPHSVAYFYFKHMKSEKNNHQSFLRAILSQLISQDAMVLQEVSAELQYESDENFQSQSNLEALTKTALEGYGVSFLVLDGLDEW
ncbi:hypothetical protein CGCS363_v006140 [Colletotrichum siamense]|uniref:uncharacterized protein n=1 Tax=Colletotrichum siamense TaxID=690259 RepID=UPI001872CB7C|nr:uncharacterized protein CGCS363_v006140 [Colletotrichum siamense]KAF5500395.1 hypothetical protein CGCS363_v006140 [Colletotrichum siamense]